ncbi:hypothetical protein VTN31DRAFT_5857 [Thermomyces dupontii]|uniref:uncharacterized protein n=1 Tax=Talaromyces thermophilus TaxID=28565 RepID=UPI003742FD0B
MLARWIRKSVRPNNLGSALRSNGSGSNKDTDHDDAVSLQERLLEAPYSEQLGFLTWLFDEALRQRLPASPDTCTDAHGARPAADHAARRCHRPPRKCRISRKSRRERWTLEESGHLEDLLINRKLPVSDAIREFSKQFPGRSEAATKSYIYTRLIGPNGKPRLVR